MPGRRSMIYFDHNATTPLLAEAARAWMEACQQYPGNPSSPHRLGTRAETALNQARQSLANLLDCDLTQIVWTSGATESNNMVLHHLARTGHPDDVLWISAIEHPCLLEAAGFYFPKRHRLIPVGAEGTVDLNWLSAALAESRPALVAVMAANNETGILQPWREALAMCRQYEVPFLCDAVQWLGKLPAIGLGDCDYLSGCAHKFGGPRGVGFLKVPDKARLTPLLRGGPQEEGQRAGTENVPGILSMLAALEFRSRQIQSGEHLPRLEWRKQFETQLAEKLSGASMVGGNQTDRLWNTVSAILPELPECQRWVVKLDKLGLAASTGSACSSGKEAPSHVLTAMKLNPGQASRVLRFSSGWETTADEWHSLLDRLLQISDLRS